MSRKISIETVVEEANSFLKHSDQPNTEGRQAICSFVERLLHKSNSYNGFRYLIASELAKPSDLPGIIPDYSNTRNNKYPDQTRRAYY